MTKRNLFRLFICLCFSYFYVFTLSAQNIHYVDRYATGANDGSNWQDAYISLQTAMGVAEYGDEIWVAEGTYQPTNTADRNISFELPLGVKLYGSFNGTESSPEERDLTNLNTVLSGDIGLLGLNIDNSYTVLYVARADSLNLLDGLTIEKGYGEDELPVSGDRIKSGAGIYYDSPPEGALNSLLIQNCSLRDNITPKGRGGAVFSRVRCEILLRDCIFSDNKAIRGGALTIHHGSSQDSIPDMERCTFERNEAQSNSGAISFFANIYGQEIWLNDCSFYDNRIHEVGSGWGFGAAVTVREVIAYKGLLVTNCHFVRNRFSNENSILTGGGICLFFSSLSTIQDKYIKIQNVTFIDNNGAKGSAIATVLSHDTYLDINISHCVFKHSSFFTSSNSSTSDIFAMDTKGEVQVNNCLWVQENELDNAFIKCELSDDVAVHVGQSTFYDAGKWAPTTLNHSRSFFSGTRDVTITNSVFSVPPQRSLSYAPDLSATIDVDYSIFTVPDCEALHDNSVVVDTINCDSSVLFNTAPLFADPENGDFTLQAGSPAIDAGINTALLPTDSLDLNGQARIVNGIVDMGAYEWAPPAFAVALDSVASVSCPGGTDGEVFLTLTGVAPFEINWENENDGSGTGLDSLSAGNYTFTITDAMGEAGTIEATITQPPAFTLAFNSTAITCPGESNGQAAVLPSGGTPPYSYSWNDGTTDSLITGLAAGVYWVTVSDAHACERIAGVNLNNPDSLSVDFETIEPTCFDEPSGTIIAQPTGGTPPYSSAWWNGVNGNTLADIPAGFHPYYLTDANGCTLVDTAFLDQPEILSLLFDYTPVSCPFSMDAQLVATGQGGTPPFSYIWNTGAEGDTLSMIGIGTYTVSIEDANACQADFSFITPPITPVFVAAGVDSVACSGMANGVMESWAQGTLPIIYEWSTGDTTTSVSDVPTGLYSITITDALGCIDSTTVMMPELPPIEVELVSTGTSASANNGTASIVDGGSFSYTYLWNTGATTPEITGLAAGTYQVSVTDDYGCEAVFSVEVELINTVDQSAYSTIIPVYPNPVKANLIMELPSKLCKLRFYNAQGELLQELQAKGYTDLKFHHAAGIYFYEIEIDKRVVQRGKLVVAR